VLLKASNDEAGILAVLWNAAINAHKCRQKNKQKYESREHEVHAMADLLRSLEGQKAELEAQIQELLPQASRQPQPCLPDINKASNMLRQLACFENSTSLHLTSQRVML